MTELRINNGGCIEILNSEAVKDCLTPPGTASSWRCKMKNSSWKTFWNKLVLATGMLALITVASGAQVGPTLVAESDPSSTPSKQQGSSPYALASCNKKNFLKDILGIPSLDQKCGTTISNNADGGCQSSICQLDRMSQGGRNMR